MCIALKIGLVKFSLNVTSIGGYIKRKQERGGSYTFRNFLDYIKSGDLDKIRQDAAKLAKKDNKIDSTMYESVARAAESYSFTLKKVLTKESMMPKYCCDALLPTLLKESILKNLM